MNRFEDILLRAHQRLDLPQPARARILLELAADLEDGYARLRERGLDEEEARREAADRFALSDEALDELVELHSRRLRRWLYGLRPGALSRLERGLAAGILVFVATLIVPLVLRPGFFAGAGPAVWVTLAGTGLGAVLFLFHLYEMEVKQRHEIRSLYRGAGRIAGLGVLNVVSGMFGSAISLTAAAHDAAAAPEHWLEPLVRWLSLSSALMVTALLGGIVCALLWFGLQQRIGRIATLESESLIGISTPPTMRKA